METKEKNQINQQIIERAAFAATVAEAVVGNIGMRIVKHELDRLPIEELVAVWAGVHRLLGGERWEEALRMPRHVRQTAWFLAALIKHMPWPGHEELKQQMAEIRAKRGQSPRRHESRRTNA